MDGFDRDAAIKKRTAGDLFRHKTTIVADLFKGESKASNDFDMNGLEFPKLNKRRPTSGNAWKHNNPAVRQLSSLGKQTVVPKYYPLGLWQHHRQADLPKVHKVGLLSTPRKTDSARAQQRKQEEKDSKLFGGAKQALPPLHVTRAPSYQYRQDAKPSLLNTSVTNGFHDELENDEETPCSTSEPTPDHLAPWERTGYSPFAKKPVAEEHDNTNEASERTATPGEQFTEDLGEKQRYFAVSESDFEVPLPEPDEDVGETDLGRKKDTEAEESLDREIIDQEDIDDGMRETPIEPSHGMQPEQVIETGKNDDAERDNEKDSQRKKRPLTRRRVVHFGETAVKTSEENIIEKEKNSDDVHVEYDPQDEKGINKSVTEEAASTVETPDVEILQAMKDFARHIVSGAIQAAFLAYQKMQSEPLVDCGIVEDDDPKDGSSRPELKDENTECNTEDAIQNMAMCPPLINTVNVCFILGPGTAEETASLMEETIPKCRKDLAQKGFHLSVMCFNMDDLDIMDPALRMGVIQGYIDECRRYGLGPFYFVLLGQKYGQYDPPLDIPTVQYKMFKELWQSGLSVDLQLLNEWYEESGPDKFTLKSVQSMLDDHTLFNSCSQNTGSWSDVRSRMCDAIECLTRQAGSEEYMDANSRVQLTSATDSILRYIFDAPSNDWMQIFQKNSSCLALELKLDGLDLGDTDVLKKIDSKTMDGKTWPDKSKLEKLEEVKKTVSNKMRYTSTKVAITECGEENGKYAIDLDVAQHFGTFFKDILEQTHLINTHVSKKSSVPFRMQAERWSQQHAIETCHVTKLPDNILTQIMETMLDPNKNHPLIITSGKRQKLSSVISRLQTLTEEWVTPSPVVISRRMGITRMSSNLDKMLLNLCHDICEHYELDYKISETTSIAELSKWLLAILHKASTEHCPERPLVLLLDSIDMATMRDNTHVACLWLPKDLPDNVYIIVTLPNQEKILLENLQKRVTVSDCYISIDPASPDVDENKEMFNAVSKLDSLLSDDKDILQDTLSMLAVHKSGLPHDVLVSSVERGQNNLPHGRVCFSIHCIRMLLSEWMQTVYDFGTIVHKMDETLVDHIIERYTPGSKHVSTVIESILEEFHISSSGEECCNTVTENMMHVFADSLAVSSSEVQERVLKQTWLDFSWLSKLLSVASPREVCKAIQHINISNEALAICFSMIWKYADSPLPPLPQFASDIVSGIVEDTNDSSLQHLMLTTKKWIHDSKVPALVSRSATKHHTKLDILPIDGPTDVICIPSAECLLTWGADSGIQVWDAGSSKLRYHLSVPQNTKDDVLVNLSGNKLYHTDSTMLFAWNLLTGQLEGSVDLLPNVSSTGRTYNSQKDPMPFLTTGAVSKDGSLVAVCINYEEMLSDRNGIVIVDTHEMVVKTAVGRNLYGMTVREMTFTDDGQYLVITCAGKINCIAMFKTNAVLDSNITEEIVEETIVSDSVAEQTEQEPQPGTPQPIDDLGTISHYHTVAPDPTHNDGEPTGAELEDEVQVDANESSSIKSEDRTAENEEELQTQDDITNTAEIQPCSSSPSGPSVHTVQLPHLGEQNERVVSMGTMPLSGVWSDETLILGCYPESIAALEIRNKCLRSRQMPGMMNTSSSDASDNMKVFVVNGGNIVSVHWRQESSPVVLKRWSQDLEKLSEMYIDYSSVLSAVKQSDNANVLVLAYRNKIVFLDVEQHVCTHVVDGLSDVQWVHITGDTLLVGSGTESRSMNRKSISEHGVPAPYDKNLDVDDLDTDRSSAETIHVIPVPSEPISGMTSPGETLGLTHMVAAGGGLVTIVGDSMKNVIPYHTEGMASTNMDTLEKQMIDLIVLRERLVGLAVTEDTNEIIIMHWELKSLHDPPLLYRTNFPPSSKRHHHLLSYLSSAENNETELAILDLCNPEDELHRYMLFGVDPTSQYNISQGGRYCVIPSEAGLSVWRLSQSLCENRMIPIPSTSRTFVLRHDELMVGTAQGSVHIVKLDQLWDQLEDIPMEHVRNVVPHALRSLSLTPDEQTVVITDAGHGLTLMSGAEPDNYQKLPVDDAKIQAWTMSNDALLFVSANAHGDLRLWCTRTKSVLATACTRCAVAALSLVQGDTVLAVWLDKGDRQTSRLVFYDLVNIPDSKEQDLEDEMNGA